MSIWSATSRGNLLVVFASAFTWVFACVLTVFPAAAASDKDTKPSISIKSSPVTGFAPFRVVLTVDIRGGADDYEQYYCATAEWDMGDGNKAEQAVDCDPYEAGKSQIKRRYIREQIFDTPGEFRVVFKLKQKNKVVGSGATMVRVRPGLRDGDEVIR